MKIYHFYDPDGRVFHSQFALSDEAADDIKPLVGGRPWVANEGNAQGYARNGVFVPFPEQPSTLHVFDYSLYAWIDPRTIAEHQAAAWDRIKVARSAALAEGEMVDGVGKFDTDAAAQINVTATYTALDDQPADWTVEWTMFDNSTLVLDKETFRTAALAILGHANEVHSIGRALRHAIEITTDIAALDAIAWPT